MIRAVVDGLRTVLRGLRRVRCAVSPWHDTMEVVGYTERGPMLRCRRCRERRRPDRPALARDRLAATTPLESYSFQARPK